MARPGRSRLGNPYWVHGTTSLLLALAGTIALWYALSRQWHWEPWLAAWLVAVNVVAFAYYGLDKARARSATRRVPELVLHGLALAGGSIGAYFGMRLFRHKTIKGGAFRVLFWVIVAFQLALIVVLARKWMYPPT